jgi:hypothetical protein
LNEKFSPNFPDSHPADLPQGEQKLGSVPFGSGEGIEITYGEDVRDWWNWDKSKETKRGKVAWTGTNAAAKMYELDVRLYESSWTNPKPDLEIASITFSSRMDNPGAPFCVALTAQD